MRRLVSAAFLALAAASLVGLAGAASAGRDDRKVPPREAERVLQATATGFGAGDSGAVCAQMEGGAEGRLFLRLSGVPEGSYTKDQASEALRKQYFGKRTVISLTPGEDCTTCDDWTVVRTYRLRVRVGQEEKDGTLSVRVERKSVGEKDKKAYAWFLTSLRD